jgi:hypothetical protein
MKIKITTWIEKGEVYYPAKELGDNYCVLKRGKRVKSKYLPITETLDDSIVNLNWWAQDRGFRHYKPVNDLLSMREDIEVSKTGELFAHSRYAKNAIDNATKEDKEIFIRIITSIRSLND